MPRKDPIPAQGLPTLEELRAWAAPGPPPRVTVHLPIQRAVPDVRQNALLLEQAAREVEQRLVARGVTAESAADRASALRRVDVEVARLAPATRALVVLLDERGLRPVSLHVESTYAVTVAESFALRPLLGALQRHGRHRVLAVSVNRVALFEGGPEGLAEAKLEGLPRSLADALGDQLTEKQMRVRGTNRGGAAPSYYSHGSGKDERKLDLVRFHEALARVLGPALGDPSVPIVLAATDEHQGGLRAVANLPGLLEEGLSGNFDHASAAELAARSAPLVERWLAARSDAGVAAWERARNRGKAVDLLDDVGAAALSGRVQRLWVDAARHVPGRLDPQTGHVVPGADGDDALDALCEWVLVRGGEVVPLDGARLPSSTGAAAELR